MSAAMKKSPKNVDLKKWMDLLHSELSEVTVMRDDSVQLSTYVLPEVFIQLKGLSKIDQIEQKAIVNAALIQYLDMKQEEMGIKDFAQFANIREFKKPSQSQIESALIKPKKK